MCGLQENAEAASAEFEKLKVEHNKQADIAQEVAKTNENMCKRQTDVVGKLEESRKERSSLLASLQSQLSSVESEYAMAKAELSEKIETLTPQFKELSVRTSHKFCSTFLHGC